MDWMTTAGTFVVAAITALLRSQGRDITATDLGQKADGYLEKNVRDLAQDEAEEAERYRLVNSNGSAIHG
jgi:hypothetical protein